MHVTHTQTTIMWDRKRKSPSRPKRITCASCGLYKKNIYLLDEEVFSCKNTLCVREGRGSHIRKEIIHQSDSLTPRRHNAIISSFETRAVLLYGDTVLSSPDYLVSKQHAVSFSRGSRLSLRQYGES